MDSDADKDEDQSLRASEKPSEKQDVDYSSLHGHLPTLLGCPKLASYWNMVFFFFFKKSKWHSPHNTMKMFQAK